MDTFSCDFLAHHVVEIPPRGCVQLIFCERIIAFQHKKVNEVIVLLIINLSVRLEATKILEEKHRQ